MKEHNGMKQRPHCRVSYGHERTKRLSFKGRLGVGNTSWTQHITLAMYHTSRLYKNTNAGRIGLGPITSRINRICRKYNLNRKRHHSMNQPIFFRLSIYITKYQILYIVY